MCKLVREKIMLLIKTAFRRMLRVQLSQGAIFGMAIVSSVVVCGCQNVFQNSDNLKYTLRGVKNLIYIECQNLKCGRPITNN